MSNMTDKMIGKLHNYIIKVGNRANTQLSRKVGMLANFFKPDDIAYFKADGTPVEKSKAQKFQSHYTRGYNSFSGIDIKVIFEEGGEKKRIGTIQGFSYLKEVNERGKVVTNGSAVFICFDPVEDWLGKEVRIIGVYANEYGKLGLVIDEKIKFVRKSYGISVDDIVSEERYDWEGTLNETVEQHMERIAKQNEKYTAEEKAERKAINE